MKEQGKKGWRKGKQGGERERTGRKKERKGRNEVRERKECGNYKKKKLYIIKKKINDCVGLLQTSVSSHDIYFISLTYYLTTLVLLMHYT